MMLALAGFTLLPLGCGGNSSSSTSKPDHTPAGTYNFQVMRWRERRKPATSFTLIVQ
jgi:hypothetical protein